jgi:hypothetical protein
MELKVLVSNNNKAVFSKYIAGNLYYKVITDEGEFEFPIKAVDKFEGALFKLEAKTQTSPEVNITYQPVKEDLFRLSEDLGTATFENEYKAITLMRYINKAIKNGELVKL